MSDKYFVGSFEAPTNKQLNNILKKNKQLNCYIVLIESKDISFLDKKRLLQEFLLRKNADIQIISYDDFLNLIKNKTDYSIHKIKDLKSSFIHLSNKTKLDIPKEYINYILDNHLFSYKRLYEIEGENRYLHSVSVAKTAIYIGKSQISGKDLNRVFISSILHDIAKPINEKETFLLMEKYYPSIVNKVAKDAYHQFLGVYFARKLFFIKNSSILDAIKYHTTGKPNMSIIEKIVYSADKIEPRRGYDSNWMIEKCKKNINLGFTDVIRENMAFLRRNNVSLDELTSKMEQYYLRNDKN